MADLNNFDFMEQPAMKQKRGEVEVQLEWTHCGKIMIQTTR
uniref:Uncharacterized protein n=1 Tax=Arundo donax TaxID=35708 RepID=A0A0A9EAA9_ARUDO